VERIQFALVVKRKMKGEKWERESMGNFKNKKVNNPN